MHEAAGGACGRAIAAPAIFTRTTWTTLLDRVEVVAQMVDGGIDMDRRNPRADAIEPL
jgi:hypothetical protein